MALVRTMARGAAMEALEHSSERWKGASGGVSVLFTLCVRNRVSRKDQIELG